MKASRISDAFPPDLDEEDSKKIELCAKIHASLAQKSEAEVEKIRAGVYFTEKVTDCTLNQLRDLHREFFPVEYKDGFYRQIERGELRVLNCQSKIEGRIAFTEEKTSCWVL